MERYERSRQSSPRLKYFAACTLQTECGRVGFVHSCSDIIIAGGWREPSAANKTPYGVTVGVSRGPFPAFPWKRQPPVSGPSRRSPKIQTGCPLVAQVPAPDCSEGRSPTTASGTLVCRGLDLAEKSAPPGTPGLSHRPGARAAGNPVQHGPDDQASPVRIPGCRFGGTCQPGGRSHQASRRARWPRPEAARRNRRRAALRFRLTRTVVWAGNDEPVALSGMAM